MTTRHTWTLAEKIKLIRANEETSSYRTLADKYKISIGSVSNIIKRKTEYIEDYEQNQNSNKKRNVRDEFSQLLDQQVYEWFVAQRSKNIPVSGPLLQEKARQIRQQIGGVGAIDFKGSNGWLEKFRQRHGIQHRVICGESASVDPATVEEWKRRLPSMIEKYTIPMTSTMRMKVAYSSRRYQIVRSSWLKKLVRVENGQKNVSPFFFAPI